MPYDHFTFNARIIEKIDKWLDREVSDIYKNEPLAQDWARIAKIGEELGEAIQAFIGNTGQNPRKGFTHTNNDVLEELADTAWTAIFAIQHFTNNTNRTAHILNTRLARISERVTVR